MLPGVDKVSRIRVYALEHFSLGAGLPDCPFTDLVGFGILYD